MRKSEVVGTEVGTASEVTEEEDGGAEELIRDEVVGAVLAHTPSWLYATTWSPCADTVQEHVSTDALNVP